MVNTEIRLIVSLQPTMEKLYTVGETLYSQRKQDRELTVAQIRTLIAKFKLKLKKVGKTTRPLRYDLSQIRYDYTLEVRNIFKGLYLIECLMNNRRVHDIVQETGSKNIPKKNKHKKTKWLSEGALKIAVKGERQRRKGNIYPFECTVPKK